MTVLRIEHGVADYDTWKASFDADPVGRAASGVLSHQILRSADNPNYVMIDLEFSAPSDAATMLGALQQLWNRLTGTLISGPQARIVELAERRVY
jgi:hypothetical protein